LERSGGLYSWVVFVEEASEDGSAGDAVRGEGDDVRVVGRCAQGQGAVGSAGVVVLGVFVEDALEVVLADNACAGRKLAYWP
jgi:hypothetical protein